MKSLLMRAVEWLDQLARDFACRQGHLCTERNPATAYEDYWCRVCRRSLDVENRGD